MARTDGDILGHPEIPLRQPPLLSPVQLAVVIVIVSVVAFFGLTHLGDALRRWQERSYRKAMRRRHGIPDDDHRPFNVAYAAVVNARKERERAPGDAANRNGRRNALAEGQQHRLARSPEPEAAMNPAYAIGERNAIFRDPAAHYPSPPVEPAASHRSPIMNNPMEPYTYNPMAVPPGGLQAEPIAEYIPPAPRNLKVSQPYMNMAPRRGIVRKHEDEADSAAEGELGTQKKSRVEGEELIDGDEDTVWHENRPQRGAKRSTEDDDARIRRDKRARKSQAPAVEADETEDELMELDVAPRGRHKAAGMKRRQSEAGSTFGGDGDSTLDSDDDESEKHSRHRKRRTLQKRKSEIMARGRKRDRQESSSDDGMDTSGSSDRSTSRKRGKRASTTYSDEYFLDSGISTDPLCQRRRIGEEWSTNGIKYKVGPNGQRLRQALIKKKQPTKFPMPSDSQHPDRGADLLVCVETWLSEEEYRVAKEQGDLAWQDSTPVKTHPVIDLDTPYTPGDVPDSPSKTGKNLLWSSTMESPAPRRTAFRQSVATNMGLRINPFQQSQTTPNLALGRRLSTHGPLNLPSDSPKRPTPRTLSKWEKQDMEAAAMSKMREKVLQKSTASSPSTPAGSAAPSPSAPAPSFALPKPGAAATTPFTLGEKAPEASFPKPAAAPSAGPASLGLGLPGAPRPRAPGAGADTAKTASPFAMPGAPASVTSAPSPNIPKAPFSFAPAANAAGTTSPAPASASTTTGPTAPGMPNAAAASPFTPSGASAPKPPTFSFSTPSAQPGVPAEKKAEETVKPAAFSWGQPGQSAAPENKPEPAAASGNPLLGRMGGFAPPPQPDPKPAAANPPTFSFSFGKPGGTAAPSSTPTANTTQPPPAPAAAFGFGAKPSEAPAPKPTEGPKPATFTFGTPSTPAASNGEPKSVFGATAPANPAPAPKATFAFGQPTPPATDAPKSAFGASAGIGPKPTFGFGAPSSTPVATPSAPTEAQKAAPFTFNFGGGSAAPAGPGAGSPFGGGGGFGAGATPAFGANPGANVFNIQKPGDGKSSAPNPFGAASTPSTTTPFTFGFSDKK